MEYKFVKEIDNIAPKKIFRWKAMILDLQQSDDPGITVQCKNEKEYRTGVQSVYAYIKKHNLDMGISTSLPGYNFLVYKIGGSDGRTEKRKNR